MKEITKEMREKLRKPLPKEAISQHPTKTYLSSIKAIYVEERLNEVFGIGSWQTEVEFIEKTTAQKSNKNSVYPVMVVCKLKFQIPEYGIKHECFGGNDNEDLGDAYKGATTDAITKVGSYLEIGIDVFKGYKDKVAPREIDLTSAFEKLEKAKDTADLTEIYKSLKPEEKSNEELISFCAELKLKLIPVIQ